MGHIRLYFNTLAAISFFAAALAGQITPASAKHDKSLQDLTLSALMSDLKVQAIKQVPLPAFTLPDVDNKDFAIKDQIGKVILINFWTTY